jgi:hypothetical protein
MYRCIEQDVFDETEVSREDLNGDGRLGALKVRLQEAEEMVGRSNAGLNSASTRARRYIQVDVGRRPLVTFAR